MHIYRHKLPIRIIHWINVICFIVLFMTGLNIFNAHSALNIGKSSYNGQTPVFEIKSRQNSKGELIGVTNILGYEFNTTGFLGASAGPDGKMIKRGFPTWLTIPSPK